MATMNLNDFLSAQGLENDRGIAECFDAYLRSLPLAALREVSGVTQAEMGRRLGKSQAAVSKFEGRSDFLFSTFFNYIKQLGGTVDITASLAGEEFELGPVWSEADCYVEIRKKMASHDGFARAQQVKHAVRSFGSEVRKSASVIDWNDVVNRAEFLKPRNKFVLNSAANDEPQSFAA